MSSMQARATHGDGPVRPRIILLALASGYVAGYGAAYGVSDTPTALGQAMIAAVAWLFCQQNR
ncbi:hypothetical protein SSP35_01_09070 [Streptomyces sp. NBRC 110611]|uniref:hypothetical protein n=1 Tax=Streptomyces sp. NBRC 110611 TaxID=1621259 RepID=UPI0008338BE7|nr:hypothetical protein [Streptomyces sp. NBRC 110611]GAU65563.1 hypothetical protein SSP35_01_09070 [Streptomyces sp. NBRC 110611]